MPRVCTVCTHPNRPAIDQALARGDGLPRISALFRVSDDALTRHRDNHLPATVQQGQAAAAAEHALDVVTQLRAINQTTLHILKEARDQGKAGIALQAIDRVQRQIELQAKLLGELDDRPVINLLVAPEWLRVRAALVAALAPYPAAAQAVAARLLELEAG